jgi:hypothetical protein
MSHTQGKLIAQTYGQGAFDLAIDVNGITLVIASRREHLNRANEMHANARRIVACWNASIGIPTAELEAAADGRLLNIFEGLISERDELLAALKQVIGVIDAAGLHNLSNGVQLGQTVWYVKASDAKDAARAAIERAEKGSA